MNQNPASLPDDELDDNSFLASTEARKQRLFDAAIWLALLVAILVVYGQVRGFEFQNYDTGSYVYQNPNVMSGFSIANLRWAFTSPVVGNWVPITMLSHILDAQLFGAQNGMHHLANVLYHVLACILVFASLKRATGARGPSVFVTFVFALHPLHVESVAWVAERKDVLSALFWFLALYLYVRYAERPSAARYLAMAAAFALGLMAKPMVVTFPFVLLLFDLWPLRRFPCPTPEALKLVWEKVPLVALTVADAVITYFVQGSAGALVTIPLPIRIENALASYWIYFRQMFWPTRLAVFYPYPNSFSPVTLTAGAVIAFVITVLAIAMWRKKPYVTAGWLWFIGTLIPVIGLVQVGKQGHADRYMYIPMVGLLIALAWAAEQWYTKLPAIRLWLELAGTAVCLACLLTSRIDTAYWQNSGTLFQRAVDVTESNVVAEEHLALYEYERLNLPAAIVHYQAALAIDPTDAAAEAQIGSSLVSLEGCSTALPHLEAAVRLDPRLSAPFANLGRCLRQQMDYEGAVRNFEAAVRATPDFAEVREDLALTFLKIPGRTPDAIREFEAAVRLRPQNARLHGELGMSLESVGRRDEAIQHLEAAMDLEPLGSAEVSSTLNKLRAGRH